MSSASNKKAVEAWAKERKTPAWLFAAAKQKHGWAQGKQVTEETYVAAVAETAKHRIG